MRTSPARRALLNVVGLLVFVAMVFPVYWMVSTAFKPGDEIFANTLVWFPYHPTLSNFGNGTNSYIEADNSSPGEFGRAFDGAVLFALNQLLADEKFIAYMKSGASTVKQAS